jgi:hypothetical protein
VGFVQLFLLGYTYQANKRNADAASDNAAAAQQQVNALQDTLIETRKAAEAAKQGADTAERALTDLERPWIFIEPIQLDGFIRYPPQSATWPLNLKLRWTMRNYGRSPAFVTRGCGRLIIIPMPLPEDPDYTGASDVVTTPVPPNKTIPNEFIYLLGADELQKLKMGTHVLAFFGFIRYIDVFNRPHESAWCATLQLPALVQPGQSDRYWEFGGPPAYTRYT